MAGLVSLLYIFGSSSDIEMYGFAFTFKTIIGASKDFQQDELNEVQRTIFAYGNLQSNLQMALLICKLTCI